jgi:hypothetical protein
LEAEELTVSIAYDFSHSDTRAFSPRGAGINRASDVSAFSSPDWKSKAAQRFVDLTRLPIGWDGHQGYPVSPRIADYAFQLLQTLMLRPGLSVPSITPLAYGGILLEWHRLGWDVEIEIDAPASHHVHTYELATHKEEQFLLGTRLERLRGIMAHIAD